MSSGTNSNVNGTEKDDDEYEEVIVVADLKGVLDPNTVSRALSQNNIALRFANTDKPIVQIGSSMFTGEWTKTLGTDIVYKSSKMPFSSENSDQTCEFLTHSSTRLTATKAIVSKQK